MKATAEGQSDSTEPWVQRLGLMATGIILWRSASNMDRLGIVPLHLLLALLLPLLYLAGLAFLTMGAMARGHHRFVPWIFPALTLACLVYGVGDAYSKWHSGILLTTDGHVYLDYAARLIATKNNPYDHSMLGAFRLNNSPLVSTPLLDGDLTSRVSYPALSFLVLVPFTLLRIPTYLAYPLFLWLAFALVYRFTRVTLRPIVLIPFFTDESFLSYSFVGVTDSVWTVFMLLAIVAWRRPWVAALFYGLACAYKQQPWLLVPFIAIRLYLEHHGTAYRRGEGVVRFFGTALIAFLVVNLPFILWSPWNWVLGCFEPAHASMIGFGQGLAELTVTGYVLVPKVVYSLLTLASMTLLAVAYARHFSVLRDFMWIAPAIAFWFNHRSLTSYWYFNALLLGLAVFRDGALAPVGPWRSARPTLLGAGAFSLGSALVMVHFSGREQPFVIHVVEPVVTWGRSAYSLRLRLKNRLSRPVEPRFTLQASGVQPLQWHIDSGPRMLPPLEEADYTLSSIQVVAEFELTKGARLVVSDKGSTSVRTSASIVGDHTALYPAAIANGSFRFWDASSHAPSGWQVVRGGSGCSVVKVLPHSDDTVENRVQLTLNGNVPVSTWAINGQPCTHVPGTSPPELAWSAVDKRPFVAIGTDLVLPEGALYFAVHPPAEANMAPETGALYGVRLLAAGRVLLVLFGGVEKRGVLLDGTPYLVMPAPSETWSVQPLHIRPLFAEFKVALHETRTRLPRLAQLDFPMVVVHVQLFAAAPDAGTSLSAVFGPVTNAALQQDPWAGIRRDLDAPWQVDSWHGQFNFASGNFDKARIHLRRAAYDHPTAEALLAYGDAALLDGKLEEAIQAYRRAMQGGDSARGNDGLRWGPYDASDDVSAHVAFVRAIERLDKADWEAKSSYLYDAWLGLGKVALRRGDRPTLERAIAAIVKLGQIPPDELTHPAKAQ